MDLEVLTNIVNNYDPALLGVLAISAPTMTGFVLYSTAKQIYHDVRNRKANKNLAPQESSQDNVSGYKI